MKLIIKHIVTKASDDGTIGCVEAQGWIEKEDVEAVIRGMQSDVDLEWYAKKKKALQSQLDAISSIVD